MLDLCINLLKENMIIKSILIKYQLTLISII